MLVSPGMSLVPTLCVGTKKISKYVKRSYAERGNEEKFKQCEQLENGLSRSERQIDFDFWRGQS